MKHKLKTLTIAIGLIYSGLTTFAQESMKVTDAQTMSESAQHSGNPQQQQNTLILANNTGKKIKTSFVYFDKGCNCWTSRGWRWVQPYENYTIDLGGLNIGNRVMYVHAQAYFHRQWGETLPFFMRHSGAPLTNADRKHHHCSRLMFTEVNLQNGQNTYTFNP